jgi:inner membrane protein
VHYGDFWGHRGFTHSLLFTALVAITFVIVAFRRGAPSMSRSALLAYLFLAGASHGVLDAMTSAGLGVAFFSPFDTSRYFLPWRPILVSPISPGRFFSMRAYTILASEFVWVWMPVALISAAVLLMRRGKGADPQLAG